MLINTKYKIIYTTADIGLSVKGSTLRRLFLNALSGMVFLIFEKSIKPLKNKESERIKIKFTGDSYENLLVQFLSEVLFLIESQGKIPFSFKIDELNNNQLSGLLKLTKTAVNPVNQIKAVTYHGLKIKAPEKGAYLVDVIFDI